MPQTTKKSAAEKIVESLGSLSKVSADRGNIESMLKLTDNATLRTFIQSQQTRYDEDIAYLRKRIVYQAQKVATEMSVEKFDKFAQGLAKLLA